jgi:lipopolysaccharide transport system ATP-binding protein
MYVRLAFAVAAHLEPEILIIDEVLAVGDQAFQQKCLGKMSDVAQRDGRTVLFVSHNMAAVSRLCRHAVLLEDGRVAAAGPAPQIVEGYLARAATAKSQWRRPADQPLSGKVSLLGASVLDANGSSARILPHSSPVTLVLECRETATFAAWMLRISIFDRQGNELFSARDTEAEAPRAPRPGRTLRATCRVPGGLLKPGVYVVGVSAEELAGDTPVALYEQREPLVSFEISEQGYRGQSGRGLLASQASWNFEWPG